MSPRSQRMAARAVHPQQEFDSSSSSSEDSATDSSDAEAAKKARASFARPADWMIILGAVLAACAGIVNVGALLELRTVVSHMTGLTTNLGLRLEGVRIGMFSADGDHVNSILTGDSLHGHAGLAREAMLLILCFIFGAFLCGLVIPKNALHFGGKSFYGVALIGTSILCTLCTVFSFSHLRMPAACSAACASGMQNAMCTMHLGAVVRTTHVTGTATDIGSTLGRATMIVLRAACERRRRSNLENAELEADLNKLTVLVTIFTFFFVGCFLGALTHSHLGAWTFVVPAIATGLMGVLYTCFRTKMKQQIKRMQVRQLEAEIEEVAEMVQRARSRSQHSTTARVGSPPHQEPSTGDFDVQMEHALEVLQDLQATIRDIYDDDDNDTQRDKHDARGGRDDCHSVASDGTGQSNAPLRITGTARA
mmetsp:Transcript_54193/g.136892  ORF Transcript_54193/g.136892 Transcript_54193/m.136892 type:complete len:423 (+) Transcript_54193:48-1316(+)